MAQPPNVDPLPDTSGPYDPGVSIHFNSNMPNVQPPYNQPNYNQPSTNDAPPFSSPPSYDPQPSGDTQATSLPEGQVSQQQVMLSGKNIPLMVIPNDQLQAWIYYIGQWTKDPAGSLMNHRMSSVFYNPVNQNIHVYEKYYNSGRVNYRNWGYIYGQTYVHALFIADEPGWHEIAIQGSQTGWSNVIWVKVY